MSRFEIVFARNDPSRDFKKKNPAELPLKAEQRGRNREEAGIKGKRDSKSFQQGVKEKSKKYKKIAAYDTFSFFRRNLSCSTGISVLAFPDCAVKSVPTEQPHPPPHPAFLFFQLRQARQPR
ncbi:MAG: hypothetical protein L0Z53_22345 [Acidobacteriales bacterium]|nr:hypothetical protein [Terriglobales bacterium]